MTREASEEQKVCKEETDQVTMHIPPSAYTESVSPDSCTPCTGGLLLHQLQL